jgi:ADP-ribose pyrophosphatase
MTDSSGHSIPETVAAEIVLESNPFNVERSTIRFHDGYEAERTVVRHPGAVALVVIDDQQRWLLVSQYRYPTGHDLLEIPAGTRETGEEPSTTAAREIREETGYAAASLTHLGATWMAPGFCDEYIHYYLATNLTKDPLPQDHDEYISPPIRLTIDELETAIRSGEINDAKTITALTLFRLHHHNP